MGKVKTVWIGEFEGHEIKVTNEGKCRLYIDGVEVAKEKGLIHFDYELRASIPDTDYIVIAKVDGTKDVIVSCDVLIAKKLDVIMAKEDKEGIITPYTEKEIEDMRDDAQQAIYISTILN